MRTKILIVIFIITLAAGGIFSWYQLRTVGGRVPSVLEYCHDQALESAQQDYERENPDEKEMIEIGTYDKSDYDFYYRECLRAEKVNQ